MRHYLKQFAIETRRNGPLFALRKVYGFARNRLFGRAPKFGPLRHDPLVSVIVVSYNSGADLPACLASIAAQSYGKLEVIVVENGSSNTQDLVRSFFPEARWLRQGTNLGFAEGNNVGMAEAQGEFLALVNPDARLDEDCILELVQSFRFDGDVAVTTPKLRFWTRFADIHLESDAPFAISLQALDDQLDYKKYFVRDGAVDPARRLVSARAVQRQDTTLSHQMVLRLPVDGSRLDLALEAAAAIKSYSTGAGDAIHPSEAGHVRLALSLAPADHVGAFWVVNNAGTGLGAGGPFDIGFGERDELLYDGRANVPAFCGCVALIRRAALIGRPIFRPEFFAYFEDSELSHHCQSLDYRIQYSPRALAWHKHSVSSSEGSPLWTLLVARSRLIYERYRGGAAAQQALDTFLADTYRYQNAPKWLIGTLAAYDSAIGAPAPRGRTIGVYNSYWNTFGGGEAHALSLALAASGPQDELFLIAESDFDLGELERRFACDLSRARKLVITAMTREFTARFDLFFNATFHSNMGSLAGRSYYVVSFPHRAIDRRILADYTFLHNSRFTAGWAQRFWGPTRSEVVCPTFAAAIPPADAYAAKEKIILSIGRFTPLGHAKNQHDIIAAFATTKDDPAHADWRLMLVGGLNARELQDGAYFAKVAALARGDRRVTLLPNCPRETVNDLLGKAALYVHATGLGQPETRPEYHEHFGIAPLEACLFGVWPIVYATGGPADLVADLGIGETYRDLDDLVAVLSRAMRTAGSIEHERVAAAARAFCAQNAETFARLLAREAA